jgi:hypothetical protein
MKKLLLIIPFLFLSSTTYSSDHIPDDINVLYELDNQDPITPEEDREIESDLQRRRFLCLARGRRGGYFMGVAPRLRMARRRAFRKCVRYTRSRCRVIWCSAVR